MNRFFGRRSMKTYLILGKKKINISALKRQYGLVNLLADMKIESIQLTHPTKFLWLPGGLKPEQS